jgi:hypothetical protein
MQLDIKNELTVFIRYSMCKKANFLYLDEVVEKTIAKLLVGIPIHTENLIVLFRIQCLMRAKEKK